MLRDLRVRIRARYSKISSCSFQEFLPLSKQFFAFVESSPILKFIIAELVARNGDSVNEVRTTQLGVQVWGETEEKAAAIAYTRWSAYAAQDDIHEFYNHAMGSGNVDAGLNRYRDWYVEPLLDYLDEVLEDVNVILATITRYKHKVEWYRRKELQELYEADTTRGEARLAKHMHEYLFDQGIPFNVEPQTASGRPDVIALEDSDHPLIADVKIFDGAGRGATYIKKGIYQVYRYCLDKNETVGHLVVFNICDRQLNFTLAFGQSGVPRFEYNGKTIFITVIDIHPHQGTASTLPIPQSVTIGADDLIREVQEEERTESTPTP